MRYCFLFLYFIGYAQQGHVHSIAFYNTENFFDAIDNPNTFDDDYTPEGRMQWTEALVQQKNEQLAKVISQIGKATTQRAPLLIGLAEIENYKLLKRLTSNRLLHPYNYGIIHVDSPDYRGIDVALLYQSEFFRPTAQKAYRLALTDPDHGYKRTTRDLLVVSGYLNHQLISVLINHWPSRRGGKQKSAQHRFKAAQLHKRITDSLFRKNKNAFIISLGDYNDNPNDKSLQWIEGEKNNQLINAMKAMAKKGEGSLAHNDRWYLFDQLLFSPAWKQKKSVQLLQTAIFCPAYLYTKRGRYQGYPFRTKVNGDHLEGYSDHFPVYAIIGLVTPTP